MEKPIKVYQLTETQLIDICNIVSKLSFDTIQDGEILFKEFIQYGYKFAHLDEIENVNKILNKRIYSSKRYSNLKTKILKSRKRYYIKNKEKLKLISKKNYELNKETIKPKFKKYYEDNKELFKQYHKRKLEKNGTNISAN